MKYHSCYYGPWLQPTIDTWVPTNISAAIPPEATVVEVILASGGVQAQGVRPSGSDLERRLETGVDGSITWNTMQCEVGPDRKIETWGSSNLGCLFVICGYWTEE